MSKFVTKNIEAVKGKQQFRQLIVVADTVDVVKLQSEINSLEERNRLIEEKNLIEPAESKVEVMKGVLDLYEDSLETKYVGSFKGILIHMELVANLQNVSPKKFKDITPHKEKVKEFEFKYGDLRVYAIDLPNGKLIMHCGYKNKQEKDIRKFRSQKEQYLKSLEQIKLKENEKGRIAKK